jgi:hypothetical protein
MAVATSLDAPDAVWQPKTALQRHAAFFDPEGTGKVTMGQTWAGLGRLGVGFTYKVLLTPIINGFLGYLTQRKVSFEILIEKIADGKHPFDTGTFGDDGEIDKAALAEVLEIAGTTSMTAKEMRAHILARGNRRPQMGKLAGTLGSWFSGKEVRLFFCLAADTTKKEDGEDVPAVTPRTIRRLYDGTLFPLLARRRRMAAARA